MRARMMNMEASTMTERYCALALGILFLLTGLAGFIPAFLSLPAGSAANVPLNAPSITYDPGYGNIFGLFATNFLHDAIRITVGILGIAAFTSLSGSRAFNRAFAIAYALFAFMGLLPFTNTMFGLVPLYGHNVWFNALTALAAGYFGFIKPIETENISASPSV